MLTLLVPSAAFTELACAVFVAAASLAALAAAAAATNGLPVFLAVGVAVAVAAPAPPSSCFFFGVATFLTRGVDFLLTAVDLELPSLTGVACIFVLFAVARLLVCLGLSAAFSPAVFFPFFSPSVVLLKKVNKNPVSPKVEH